MEQAIRIHTVGQEQDFAKQSDAFAHAEKLVAAGVVFQMEFIGKTRCQQIRELQSHLKQEKELRRSCEAQLGAEIAKRKCPRKPTQ